MPSFQGKLRLPGDPDSDVRSLLTVDADRLTLSAGPHDIGEWSLDELEFSREGDAVEIEVEDEIVVFLTDNVDGLSDVVGIQESKVKRTRRRARPKRVREKSETLQSLRKTIADVPTKTKVVAGLVLGTVVLAVFAPRLLATVLALTGAAGVLLAMVALLEPMVAARIPGSWTTSRILGVALVLLTTGVLLGAIT